MHADEEAAVGRPDLAMTHLGLERGEDVRMPDTNHLIVTVHGIRTYGNWQCELEDLLEAAEPGVTVLRYQYGFFSSVAFLIPPLRWLVARQFRNFWVEAIRSVPEGARIDLVAHSFGTYLVAAALPYLPEGRKIHTVIFAGSVLRPSFPWYKYLQSRAVGRLVNECGWDDSVLLLCQCVALLMGMAGRIGFHGMVSDRFINRYYRFGHGGYFDPHRQLMREQWVPLLTTDAAVSHHDERPPLTALGGAKLFLLSNMQFIKVAGACLMLMIAVLIPLDWYRKVAYQKNAERLNHIALLTNAQEIPGRDPAHVRDLLKIDARASGNERAIDHLIGAQGHERVLNDQAADEDDEPHWWERLPGMSNRAREAYRARRYHALANQQLVAGKGDEDGSKAKAQTLYEQALKSYKLVDDYDPAHGSYALCLIDYGTLLEDRGEHEKAIQQYQKVREEVFPPNGTGRRSSRPPSLAVDSLIFENESLQSLKRWNEASDRLEEAVRIAKEESDNDLLSNDLLSNVYTYSGWLHMERLEVNQAIADFKAAEASCKDLVLKGRVEFLVRLFWIRHGLALSTRLTGSNGQAYEKYEEIVSKLRLLDHDVSFTPKQRSDLRARLINSLERRADIWFFASQQSALPLAEEDDDESRSRSEYPSDPGASIPLKVVRDFQEAIELIGNDDPSIKSRLLYKKVIARFMAELELKSLTPVPESAAWDKDSPIDLEFAEANRTFSTLSVALRGDLRIYREIAVACMALREAAPRSSRPKDAHPSNPKRRFPTRAVEQLRDLTVQYAIGCEYHNREKVEMLLLALEILLKPGVEPDPKAHRAADATRMMAVLGETTKVGSHPELSNYFERFQQIASVPALPSGNSVVRGPRSDGPAYVPTTFQAPAAPPETLLFYLRLSPGVALKLTTERVGNRAPADPPVIGNPAHTSPTALMSGRGTRVSKTE
jgi:tetratricopeptide (TPR) repeat protein